MCCSGDLNLPAHCKTPQTPIAMGYVASLFILSQVYFADKTSGLSEEENERQERLKCEEEHFLFFLLKSP